MRRERKYYVYIMSNQRNTTFYTGVTSNLAGRVCQHKNKAHKKSFTSRYNIDKLVYYEEFDSAYEAIMREKQIKAGSRKKKVQLINTMNPEWKDLSEDWF